MFNNKLMIILVYIHKNNLRN